jgi:hypothetical protein
MQTIRILFYTDEFLFWRGSSGLGSSGYGARDLKRFIEFKLKHFARPEIEIRYRDYDYETGQIKHAATKLTCDLLSGFDEVWVFGFRMGGNTEKEPENELTDAEVDALYDWMRAGGLMLTGDHSQHSEHKNDKACEQGIDHSTFRSRGYNLGHRIRRAKQLRVWEGPPTNCFVSEGQLAKSDMYNTQERGECSDDLGDDKCLQSDGHAQRLEGMPYPPHFLFRYRLNAKKRYVPIRKLPDHVHEGRVLIPETFDADWPADPRPRVVARGSDKRFPVKKRIYDLVVAYDGDGARVGRIVADSSFHHFLDMNLRGIPERDAAGNPKPGTDLDQIAQFYGNLAYWLAPKAIRRAIKKEFLFRAATHLSVLETLGNSTFLVGRVAKAALESEVGEANLSRIFDYGDEECPVEERLLSYVVTGREMPEAAGLSGHEHLLGSVVESYHDFFQQAGLSMSRLSEDPTPAGFLSGALESALRVQFSLTEGLSAQLRGGSNSFRGGSGAEGLRMKEDEMASRKLTDDCTCDGEWDSTVGPGGSLPDGTFNLQVDSNGNITGDHDSTPIERGTCKETASGHHITLVRKEGHTTFAYTGDITQEGDTCVAVGWRHGHRSLKKGGEAGGVSKGRPSVTDTDDEWVATKPVTLLSAKGRSGGAAKGPTSRKTSKGSSSRK